MQHPQQFSVLDKFRQDFRNNQILENMIKVCQYPNKNNNNKVILKNASAILARVQKARKKHALCRKY